MISLAPKKTVSGFFKVDYCNFSSYDNQRKIASLIDGVKNSGRKIILASKKINMSKDIKVSNFANMVALESNYIHGPTSLESVTVNMAQQFTGTNNLSWFSPQSNFGTRLLPEASATRYIFLRETKWLSSIYNKEDDAILAPQIFEGGAVEPKFFVPIIPMLLVNGSTGTTPGFKQVILPRDVNKIIEHLKAYCQSKPDVNWQTPSWNGFKGTVKQGVTPKQWIVDGIVEIKNTSTVDVTELPFDYTQKKYVEILDELEESKIITSYQNLCDTKKDIPLFQIKFERKNLDGKTQEQLIQILKLRTTVSETYFAYNELVRIEEFDGIDSIMNRYIQVRELYYEKRKKQQLKDLEFEKNVIIGRIAFIDLVIARELKLESASDTEIETCLNSKSITKVEGSYDYLLSMAIRAITPVGRVQYEKKLTEKQLEIDTLLSTEVKQIWLQELKLLERKIS